MNAVVRALAEQDRAPWSDAYARYACSVDSPIDDAIAERVWMWLRSNAHGLEGYAAFIDGRFVGFAHIRPFPRTLDGNVAGFLDDLWVDATMRGRGVARMLVAHVSAIARERDWTHLRWVANDDNRIARALYERIARRVDVVTFRLDTSDRR